MLRLSKAGTVLPAALALTTMIWTAPVYAECIVEGIAYRVMDNGLSDPTGPTLYIKKAPEDTFYYFVRLRDGRVIEALLSGAKRVRVLVHGDALSCPTEGIVRDLGTALREVQVIEFAAQSRDID